MNPSRHKTITIPIDQFDVSKVSFLPVVKNQYGGIFTEPRYSGDEDVLYRIRLALPSNTDVLRTTKIKSSEFNGKVSYSVGYRLDTANELENTIRTKLLEYYDAIYEFMLDNYDKFELVKSTKVKRTPEELRGRARDVLEENFGPDKMFFGFYDKNTGEESDTCVLYTNMPWIEGSVDQQKGSFKTNIRDIRVKDKTPLDIEELLGSSFVVSPRWNLARIYTSPKYSVRLDTMTMVIVDEQEFDNEIDVMVSALESKYGEETPRELTQDEKIEAAHWDIHEGEEL